MHEHADNRCLGTTGKPKCIVHGAIGTLIQHKKEHAIQGDIKAGDRLFYFTTCTWMMWHWLISGLASGAGEFTRLLISFFTIERPENEPARSIVLQ